MTNDGRASVPGFFRRWIVRKYGSSMMATIDRAGAQHDLDISSSRNDWRAHNAKFNRQLMGEGVPRLIRWPIRFGLWVYWRVPPRVQNRLWDLVG